jgi:signal transduction histidine kinase
VELSAALVRPLFDGVDLIVLVLSAEGEVQAANLRAKAELGEQTEGRPFRELVPEDQAAKWLGLLRGPGDAGVEAGLCFRDIHGDRLPVRLQVLAPFDEAGPRLLIATDLRPLFALQKRLADAQIQISEDREHLVLAALAGATAHELNQPLTAVMGYAELLRRQVPDGEPMAQTLDLVVEQAERMAGLVKKIGRSAKFETKSYVLEQRIVDFDRAEPKKK